jgi:membrane protein implicated in regulation of membrane protease activity
VGLVYLAALIIGFGTIALQLFMAGDADGDADAGHVDMEADAGGDADADADHGHDHAGHGDGGFLPIFLSIRFWTFTLLAFGLSGTLLHYLDLTSRMIVPFIALGLGLGSGLLASLTFRALQKTEATSSGSASEAVGQLAKVLVPPKKSARGKIRVSIKGQTVDLMATTDEEEIEAGQFVLVDDMREHTAHVSRAPEELLPKRNS